MPWTVGDVDKHMKGLDDRQKELWVKIANGALERCKEKGGSDDTCEGSAIRQANAVVGRQKEVEVEEEQGDQTTVEPEIAEDNIAVEEFTASETPSDYLVVEDPEKSTTWHLQVKVNGKPDHRLMGGAKAALTSPGGHRGKTYTGPNKAQAIKKLKALYKSEGLPWDEEAEETEVAEANGVAGVKALLTRAMSMLDKLGGVEPKTEAPVEEEEESMAEFAEAATGHVVDIDETAMVTDPVPLHLRVALIRPGWGNKRDNHFYPPEVLRRDAKAFIGAKMYESDHRDQEKSTRTWVSTITDVLGFEEDGSPIAAVSVHDASFAQRLRALAADKLLEKMECSILAAGVARKGKVDGRPANIVESIDKAEAVDWVTRAGAGGRVLSLAETEGETVEEVEETTPLEEEQVESEADNPVILDPTRVKELVEATNLPEVSRVKLMEGEYEDEDTLFEAIDREVAYVKELTGSGRPFAQAGSTVVRRPRTPEEQEADFSRIMSEVGLKP